MLHNTIETNYKFTSPRHESAVSTGVIPQPHRKPAFSNSFVASRGMGVVPLLISLTLILGLVDLTVVSTLEIVSCRCPVSIDVVVADVVTIHQVTN